MIIHLEFVSCYSINLTRRKFGLRIRVIHLLMKNIIET